MVSRGEIYWCDLGDPAGSGPKRRPVVIIQADEFNRSRLSTVIIAIVNSNTALAGMPGNVFLAEVETGLSKDSVVNVTGVLTVDRRDLDSAPVARVPAHLMAEVDEGLRRVLSLR